MTRIYLSEDFSHVLVLYPWYTDQEEVKDELNLAARMGFSLVTEQGNCDGLSAEGCDDWDYMKVEAPLG